MISKKKIHKTYRKNIVGIYTKLKIKLYKMSNNINNLQEYNLNSENINQLCFQTQTQNVCLSVTNLNDQSEILPTQSFIGRGIGSVVGGLVGTGIVLSNRVNPFTNRDFIELYSRGGSAIGDTIL